MTKETRPPAKPPSGATKTGPTCPLTPKKPPHKEPPRSTRMLLVELILAAVAVILILIWLAGGFHSKVPATPVVPPEGTISSQVAGVYHVQEYTIPRYEWAIGTIQAVHETALGSKVLAKVVEAGIKAGQIVKQNDVLMRLDDADLKARVAQAEAAVEIAKANLEQAKVEYDRVMNLAKQQAAAQQEITTATSGLNAAKAKVERSQSALQEAKTLLSYTVIRAPFDGVVIDKKVEAGDTVVPGQVLLRLYDPKRMQLVASVRESLAADLKLGQNLNAYIPAMKRLCCGTVAEIVPQAQAISRSFDVKVVGPCAPGIYTGMFGRLLIPLGKEQVILIPQAAVAHVGQLNLVTVNTASGAARDKLNRLQRQSVQIGRVFEDYVEVLSGLEPGTVVLVPGQIHVPQKKQFMPTYLWQGLPITDACATRPAK